MNVRNTFAVLIGPSLMVLALCGMPSRTSYACPAPTTCAPSIVSNTPCTITSPGFYVLGTNITAPPAGCDTIDITASSDVTINLNGYTVSVASGGDGINAAGGATANVTVTNGFVNSASNTSDLGLNLYTPCEVEEVSLSGIGTYAIDADTACLLLRNFLLENAGTGTSADLAQSVTSNNIAVVNSGDGFDATDGVVTESISNGNYGYGFNMTYSGYSRLVATETTSGYGCANGVNMTENLCN